ncbi:AEC family transporter [Oceaniglobus trochenteri]|uniref:AEC family transporter n=1 Tax=Oceaniglobus trochenteri TaxID=2763260 RepID=UPI001CFFE662|nr:AEC family transporter [Oceaniglobus trochenteri]
MLHVLTHNILPVFAMLALGFVMGRSGKASPGEARAINRIAFLVLQPPLIFLLITGLDLGTFDFGAIALYGLCQALGFALSYWVARAVFGRAHLEAWLLAMTVIFINTLLYIWPISLLIYGPEAALPVTAVVAWDSTFTFSFFIISMEIMAGNRASGGALRRVSGNPIILAILIALAINLSGLSLPQPVLTAAEFAGAGAAPLTLFALGVILSGHPVRPTPVILAFSALKLVAFPALIWAALVVVSPGNTWQDLVVLTAAGPSGAMAFALAMLYGVRTDSIAPVIIWTSLLSLFSLAYLA